MNDKRAAIIKIPEDKFSYTLQKEIIDNYLPKDSKITLFTPNITHNNYYIQVYSNQFKEVQECEVIPEIKIALTKHSTLNYYTITAFDMSHILDINTTVTLPTGLKGIIARQSVIDEVSSISADFWKRFNENTNHINKEFILKYGTKSETPQHSCKFDQQYTGLAESFKYCICGKKE